MSATNDLDNIFHECELSDFEEGSRLYRDDLNFSAWVYFTIGTEDRKMMYGYGVPDYRSGSELKSVLANCCLGKKKDSSGKPIFLIHFLNNYSAYNDIEGTIEDILNHVDKCYDVWATLPPRHQHNPQHL